MYLRNYLYTDGERFFLYEFSMNGESNVVYLVSKIHPWVVVSGDITLERISPIISEAVISNSLNTRTYVSLTRYPKNVPYSLRI